MRVTKKIAKLITLEDDGTEQGGISFVGMTLADFIDETGLGYGKAIHNYNEKLAECGIQPIPYAHYKSIALTNQN